VKEEVMNQEEILNMPAGIEMDMLIATKVFNRKPHPSKNKILGQVGRYVSPRHYSIAIMSAWEVAETLSDKFDFAIVNNQNFGKYPDLHYGFRLQAIGEDSHIKTIFALGETAPLAICRAALLAVVPVNSGGV
jgi:hypothetical protein